ncbi:MAG TPA: Xaa-Pro aminopeptidase, partial [Microbacteriaceae bacterium]|nr:Xaa-Pro aminopeptidase [Microbacteriaceae bacterium]
MATIEKETARRSEKEASRRVPNRSTTPVSDRFRAYIAEGWAPRVEAEAKPREQASFAAKRRERLSARYPGRRLIVPAGGRKRRSNDTDYPFRAHAAFAYLTGWGADSEPGSVLVFEPTATGHETTLYFRERAGRDSDEFYANPEIGEFWIGPRPSLRHVAGDLALPTRPLAEADQIVAGADETTLIVREADQALTARVDAARGGEDDARTAADAELARELSEMRLVKDSYEVARVREAIAATADGFDDVIRALPRAVAHRRGERLVEGVFNTRARAEGNAVGYDTIAAAGPHACILHWTRNDGAVRPGELILIDAGVEGDDYYTADITRTLPVGGTFSATQRLVYEAVREAADAAFRIVRPGIRFRDVHATAMAVIARRTAEWGMLPVDAREAQKPENQQYRRYMVHGTSHH